MPETPSGRPCLFNFRKLGQGSIVIAKLFAIGFVSSAALGSVAGRLCDRRPDLHVGPSAVKLEDE